MIGAAGDDVTDGYLYIDAVYGVSCNLTKPFIKIPHPQCPPVLTAPHGHHSSGYLFTKGPEITCWDSVTLSSVSGSSQMPPVSVCAAVFADGE